MNAILKSASFILMAMSLNACFGPMESEVDKAIERDDQILQAYIDKNNITAQKTQMGYYYNKVLEQDGATQITNNSILGIYYIIKNIDGQLIASYAPEDGPPKLFHHGEAGLVPRVINVASGLAREGEEIKLYSPSYLAYGNYGFQQLILPNSNLDINVTFAKIYTVEELKELEDQRILEYLAANELEDFTKTENGIYIRVIEPGDLDSIASKQGSILRLNFEMFHVNDTEPFAKASNETGAASITVGAQSNLKFLNTALLNLHNNSKVEILAPSHLAYGATVQIIPQEIRADLFEKGLIDERARPYEPVKFVASIKKIQ